MGLASGCSGIESVRGWVLGWGTVIIPLAAPETSLRVLGAKNIVDDTCSKIYKV